MEIRDQTSFLVKYKTRYYLQDQILFLPNIKLQASQTPLWNVMLQLSRWLLDIWREHMIQASLFHHSLVVYFSDAMWMQILLIYFNLIVKKTQLQPRHIPVSSLPYANVVPFGNHINRLNYSHQHLIWLSHQHLQLNILYSVQHSVSLYHISIFTAKQSVFSMSLPSSKESSTMPVLSSKTTMAPWHLYNIKRLRLIPSILTSRWNHFDNMSKIIAFQLKRHL